MAILYRLGEASAHRIREEMPSPPSYSAVRALLATMIEKGLVAHRKESRHYLYRPTISEAKARRAAVDELITTFFDGQAEKLVASLLDPRDQRLSKEARSRIRQVIAAAVDEAE
jgi:predicted transcriptional regulator